MKMKQAIAYYKISTIRQGRSSLGLEAQQSSFDYYRKQNEYEILDEVSEVKSPRKQRSGLFHALNFANKESSTHCGTT